MLSNACEQVHMRTNSYPPASGTNLMTSTLTDGVDPLIDFSQSNINTNGGIIQDPYELNYIYKVTGDGFEIYSRGINGRDDGGAGDDISSKNL